MNEQLIQQIADNQNTARQQVPEEMEAKKKNRITWLIFLINNEKFAIQSTQIQEIIRDVSVYSLPFVPRYIEGVLNRRGDPYTVIDPTILLDRAKNPEQPQQEDEEEKKTDDDSVALFLVFNFTNDQICIRIDDILFFYETNDDELRVFMDTNKDVSFYKGTIEYNHEEVPVLNADAFELRLKKDLQNA